MPPGRGFSQMDWLRLTRSGSDLNGLGGKHRKDITMEEVKRHKTKDDAWMVFNGSVYNITPYLKYHPGGTEILMKVAGRDGSSLFLKYHPYVNMKALMEKCLIGSLKVDPLQAQIAAEIQAMREAREKASETLGQGVTVSEPGLGGSAEGHEEAGAEVQVKEVVLQTLSTAQWPLVHSGKEKGTGLVPS
jgi:cytochrome b involved in lipid metabolism